MQELKNRFGEANRKYLQQINSNINQF